MDQPMLSKSDINSLYQIIDEANKGYLKQSHISDKPNFNILRVLATLRLLYHQSPPALYNAVLFITKNYDPQTFYHWKKAIEDLSKNRNTLLKSKSNYCRPEINTYTKTYQNSFNRSRINESQHLQSKSYAQIKIPQEINSSKQQIFEDEDQKDVSQTNAETGKRQFYTKAESVSHISKNHYISFEPYRHSIDNYHNHYYDKENINSTNVEESRRRQSAYQYIEAIQRDLNRTAKNSQTKTPIDQSFIKNITNSESPFPFIKIHQEILDPIEQQMNTRAYTFRNFNLKLKVFSSLQANNYVFMKAKANELKAKLQYGSKLILNSFTGLRQNKKKSKERKSKEQKANKFNKNNLLGKIFSVLKLFFDLRKNSEAVKVPNISNYNKMNFQFMLSLLFALNCQKQDEKMNLIDFQSKIIELIHSYDTDKIYLIVKYFGKNSWATEDSIKNLIDLYKLRISRQAFNFMKLQRQKNRNYLQIRQLNLKKQSFYALKIRWNKYVCYKNKIKTAQNKRNRILLQKVMKSMLSTAYSKKLYSKRCEYIQRKYLFHLKAKVYKYWIDKSKDSLLTKAKMTQNFNKVIQKITFFIKKIVLKNINNENRLTQWKIKAVCEKILDLKKVEIFRKLKNKHIQIQKIRQSQLFMQKYRCSMALSTWKENTNKGNIISRMIIIIKNYYFRMMILPNLQQSIQIIKIIQYTQQDTLNKTFKIIKNYVLEQKRIRQNLIEVVKNKINFMRKLIGFSSIKFDYQLLKQEKQKQQLNLKKENVLIKRAMLKKQIFIISFKNLYNQRLQVKQFQANLTDRLNLSKFKIFFSKLEDIGLVKANQQKLKANMLNQKSRQFADKILNMIFISKIEKIKTIRKKSASYSLSMIFRKIYDEECKRKQLSNQFRKTYLYNKALESLCLVISQSHQVSIIANKINQKKKEDFTKTSIVFWRKINKISRIHRKYVIKDAIKMLFSNQLDEKVINHKLKQIVSWRKIKMHKQFINKMPNIIKTKKQQIKNFKNTQSFKKWQGIARFTKFYMKRLISNKHLYMALKFRALKLCWNSFKTLASKKPKKTQVGIIYKGMGQRLSTDINE